MLFYTPVRKSPCYLSLEKVSKSWTLLVGCFEAADWSGRGWMLQSLENGFYSRCFGQQIWAWLGLLIVFCRDVRLSVWDREMWRHTRGYERTALMKQFIHYCWVFFISSVWKSFTCGLPARLLFSCARPWDLTNPVTRFVLFPDCLVHANVRGNFLNVLDGTCEIRIWKRVSLCQSSESASGKDEEIIRYTI